MSNPKILVRCVLIILFALIMGIALILPEMPEDLGDFYSVMFPTTKELLPKDNWFREDLIELYFMLLINVLFIYDSYQNEKSFSKKTMVFLLKIKRTAAENTEIANTYKVSVVAVLAMIAFSFYIFFNYRLDSFSIDQLQNLSKSEVLSLAWSLTALFDLWRAYSLVTQLGSRRQRFLNKLEEKE